MYKNNSIERECYKLRLILNTELFHIHDYSAYKDYSKKKGGIIECYTVCFTAHLIWNQEYSFLIHLKICSLQVRTHF